MPEVLESSTGTTTKNVRTIKDRLDIDSSTKTVLIISYITAVGSDILDSSGNGSSSATVVE